MTQTQVLAKQFSDLYNGSPWIDVNLFQTLEEVTAKEAATKPFPRFNSIWEIANHMIRWRETILARLNGEEVESPEDNYFYYIRDRSEQAWSETREHLARTQEHWLKHLKAMKQKDLDQPVGDSPVTCSDLVNGIIQHDAYHLGQIRLLLKQVQLT